MPQTLSKPWFTRPALLSIPCILGFADVASAHVKWTLFLGPWAKVEIGRSVW